MTLTNMIPKLLVVDSDDIVNKIAIEAAADNHEVPVSPNFYCIKDGEIAGSVSVLNLGNGTCMVSIWAHSQRINARDSLLLLANIENFCRMNGFRHIYMPCCETSPYFSYMEKFGFTETTKATKYFIKPL